MRSEMKNQRNLSMNLNIWRLYGWFCNVPFCLLDSLFFISKGNACFFKFLAGN